MRTAEAEVKSDKQLLGVCEYAVYEDVSEACDAVGDETCLGYINAQVKSLATGNFRAARTGKPTKTQLQAMAFARINQDEFNGIMGDAVRLQELLARKVSEVEAELGLNKEENGDEEDE